MINHSPFVYDFTLFKLLSTKQDHREKVMNNFYSSPSQASTYNMTSGSRKDDVWNITYIEPLGSYPRAPMKSTSTTLNPLPLGQLMLSLVKIWQFWRQTSVNKQSTILGVDCNWPHPQSSKMRKLPIIHVNVDLPVSGFAHMFFMQNAYKIQVRGTLTALRSVEFSDFTQLQRSGCKERRMQRGRQIWHLTLNLAILSMKSIELVIAGRDNCSLEPSSQWSQKDKNSF